MSYLVISSLWAAAGFVDAGFSYAYLQREYPRIAEVSRTSDTIICWLFVLFGPGSLLVSFLFGWTRHGWLFPGSKP